MRIYFAGAENPTWRQMLADAGARHVALSFSSLRRRLPKTKPYLITERFPEDMVIGLEPGDLHGKPDLEAWAQDYIALVELNRDRLDYVVEIDVLPSAQRHNLRHQLGSLCVPVWHPDDGTAALEELCDRYERVALGSKALDDIRLGALIRRHDVGFHALGATRPDDIASLRLASASSTSWTSPQRYGELIVWDGRRLRRYPPKYAEQARRKHRRDAEKAGLDVDRFLDGHAEEATKLAIWSFAKMEDRMGRTVRRIDRNRYDDPEPFVQAPVEESAMVPEEASAPSQVPAPAPVQRPSNVRELLPVMHMRQEDAGNEDDDPYTVVAPGANAGRSVLACDSCHLASKCPQFSPGSACAYDIPVVMRSRQDIDRFLAGMLEIQGQRVLFARFSEELEGGYPDPVVSQEMDRLFALTERLKEIRDNREYLKLTMEGRAQAGAISRIFGERVADPATQLPAPIDVQELTAEVAS